MIDRQIDRIAANRAEPDDPAEARRAIATATRRGPPPRPGSSASISSTPLRTSGATLLLHPKVDPCGAASPHHHPWANLATRRRAAYCPSVRAKLPQKHPAFTATAARKRLCRLRARFSHLNIQAA